MIYRGWTTLHALHTQTTYVCEVSKREWSFGGGLTLTLREEVVDVVCDGDQVTTVGLRVQARALAVLERAGYRMPHMHRPLVHGDGSAVAVQERAGAGLRPSHRVILVRRTPMCPRATPHRHRRRLHNTNTRQPRAHSAVV